MFESYHRFPAATFWRKQFFLPLVLLRIFISLSLSLFEVDNRNVAKAM
jgi:hypothetical protein